MLDPKFFISDEIAEREIELADGTKHVLFFRQLSNTDMERYALWVNSADEEVAASASSRLLAMGMCEPDGKPAITAEQAARIKRKVMRDMVSALLEVNGYGKAVEGKQGNA